MESQQVRSREREMNRASYIGIGANIGLVALKVFIYSLTGAVSVLADGMNNLTDSVSAVVTLVGSKVSHRPADAAHPFGHGRLEYIAGLAVAVLILMTGLEFIRSSVEKILHPSQLATGSLTLGLMVLSCVVKLIMSGYFKKVGTAIESLPILAQSKDCLSDVFVTGGVLLSLLIFHFTGMALDGWAGLVVSGVILYQGYELIRDTLSRIIGTANPEEIKQIVDFVKNYPGVLDVHDVMVVDFGPEKRYTWMDIEASSALTFKEAHDLADGIERGIKHKLGYHAGIHLDPVGSFSEEKDRVARTFKALIATEPALISFHDLMLYEDGMSVDVILDAKATYSSDDRRAFEAKVRAALSYDNPIHIHYDRHFE
ncbi:cation diffusion facilitator family transporter [Peptoniphilus equinus]|uniref:Cation diffusion facilitator family transporter n=1 Tax=Peptoniphilus equinus TaxID=3016343 RepID=A0ABY7QUR7_9FIRM|nr:cation diffusion facilitator family transporter [Peptoniphilus equinus]WBW49829.1 cation diffusion facilitator family transporter [Peptoniphilus equinus]